MTSAAGWDHEYRSGDWDYLRRWDEEVRYDILAALIARPGRKHPQRVLDLGCGIGLLRKHLPQAAIERYVGVDWSGEAVEQARRETHERSMFIAASIDEWEPDGPYDAIVFNEVLYYLPQPAATARRHSNWLTEGGSIFVCMWHPEILTGWRRPTSAKIVRARFGYARIWKELAAQREVVADIVVKRDRLQRWRVQQLRPRHTVVATGAD